MASQTCTLCYFALCCRPSTTLDSEDDEVTSAVETAEEVNPTEGTEHEEEVATDKQVTHKIHM